MDEWAKCKGRSYGTIVVDLERNTMIDILDRHSTYMVENWLLAHPEIHTICRDSATDDMGRRRERVRRRQSKSQTDFIWYRI